MKVCVDVCCGLGGFSQAFKEDPNWKVVTIDVEKKFNPTVCVDITKIDWAKFKEEYLEGKSPDVLLMSPPCERNSIACSQWPKKGIRKALEIVAACMEAVVILQPKAWLLENPKGRLRWFLGKPPQSIRYSDYDYFYRTVKQTDFWGNIGFPMVKKERPLKIGHVEKGWFRKGWGWDIPRKPSERSKIPEGVSKAVKKGMDNFFQLSESERK